jgi:hypothetical protein
MKSPYFQNAQEMKQYRRALDIMGEVSIVMDSFQKNDEKITDFHKDIKGDVALMSQKVDLFGSDPYSCTGVAKFDPETRKFKSMDVLMTSDRSGKEKQIGFKEADDVVSIGAQQVSDVKQYYQKFTNTMGESVQENVFVDKQKGLIRYSKQEQP